jgi:hypothetical protein
MPLFRCVSILVLSSLLEGDTLGHPSLLLRWLFLFLSLCSCLVYFSSLLSLLFRGLLPFRIDWTETPFEQLAHAGVALHDGITSNDWEMSLR